MLMGIYCNFFNANGDVLVVGIQWDHMDHTIFSLDEIFGGCMSGGKKKGSEGRY